MSWWVGLDIDTGGEEPVQVCDRNVTYNVGGLFRLVLPHPDGLRGYDKAPASEAGGVFARAAEDLAAKPHAEITALEPDNGWGSRDSAVQDLRWLAEQCAAHPKATVYVH